MLDPPVSVVGSCQLSDSQGTESSLKSTDIWPEVVALLDRVTDTSVEPPLGTFTATVAADPVPPLTVLTSNVCAAALKYKGTFNAAPLPKPPVYV
jgi:hypothetical protein